jgi:hypothetical protein
MKNIKDKKVELNGKKVPETIADNGKSLANDFYKQTLMLLKDSPTPYLLGGGYAMYEYTGIERDMKDLDIFCKPSEYQYHLKYLNDKGYQTEITDARWLAKVFQNDCYIDVIFDTVNNICTVDDSWYEHAVKGEVFGVPVKFLAPEELIWCKIYVQNRERYDGADVNHLILRYGKKLDWKRLFSRLDQHWQLLFSQIINFQFVYPADRDIVPRWLFDELMYRAQQQYELPASVEKVCRGPIIDQTQYKTDITEWEYKVVTIKTI